MCGNAHSSLYDIESNEPLAQIVNDGAKAVVASWGYLNKYIVSGHVDGSICQWNWKVTYI